MTTKVIIINLGPDAITVHKSNQEPFDVVFREGIVTHYVYEGQDLIIKENKENK